MKRSKFGSFLLDRKKLDKIKKRKKLKKKEQQMVKEEEYLKTSQNWSRRTPIQETSCHIPPHEMEEPML